MRVLIVGAGPTGLTAAVELARRGIRAEIIERSERASTLSRAVGINPLSLKLLEASGVCEKILARGIKYLNLQMYRGDAPFASLTLTRARMRYARNFIIGLPQDQTEAILRDAFTGLGGAIRYATELCGVREENDRVVAETKDGRELACDYLLGADGVASATRESTAIESVSSELGETWSIADADVAGWRHPNAFTLCLLPRGAVAVVAPLATNRLRVISNTPHALRTLPLPLDITDIRREGRFTITLRQVKQYNAGRVFLAGDAAHSHSPVGGRGMNLGIADAAEFAALLHDDALADYSRVRHAVGKKIIAGSERMRKTFTSKNPLIRASFFSAIKTATMLPPLERALAGRLLYG